MKNWFQINMSLKENDVLTRDAINSFDCILLAQHQLSVQNLP